MGGERIGYNTASERIAGWLLCADVIRGGAHRMGSEEGERKKSKK